MRLEAEGELRKAALVYVMALLDIEDQDALAAAEAVLQGAALGLAACRDADELEPVAVNP